MKTKLTYLLLLLVVFSCSKEVEIEVQEKLGAPVLIYPQELEFDVSTDVELIWGSSDNNTDNIEYSIYYNTIPNDWILAGKTNNTRFKLSLESNTGYYWYVSASDGKKESANSQNQVFKTELNSIINDISPKDIENEDEIIFTLKGVNLSKNLILKIEDYQIVSFVSINKDYSELKFKAQHTGNFGNKLCTVSNSKGVILKEFNISFKEKNIYIPEIKTLEATDINSNSAKLNSELITNGGVNLIEKGFYWGQNLTDLHNKELVTNVDNSFDVSNLDGNTTYYYKSYATNIKGISFGDIKEFTTLSSNNTIPSDLFEMVYIQGGTSRMGNDNYVGTGPSHDVSVDSYYIGKYEVTQLEWKTVMGNNPSHFQGDNLPVEQVSWNQVNEFIKKLNKISGKKYRLPTEAEWEFVAIGGPKSTQSNALNSTTSNSVAWYSKNSDSKTHPVGEKAANEFGVYDIFGNVSEWCQDWLDENSYTKLPTNNPKGPDSGEHKVWRGGSWLDDNLSSFFRGKQLPSHAPSCFGFRLALSL